MNSWKILLSNLGYARGINGQLLQHVRYAHRHFYCSPRVQKSSLRQLKSLIEREDPDLCCFVEIDQGSFTSGGYDQMRDLVSDRYPHHDSENKYGPNSLLRAFFLTSGKSNGFISKQSLSHEKIFFKYGTKRLIYKIRLEKNLTLFFAHFSLDGKIRKKQILEIRELLLEARGEVILLGDFNILSGMTEILPLLEDTSLLLLNREEDHTFTFHRKKLVLDLCICSKSIAERAHLEIVPQPFSDHAALVLQIRE